MGAYMYFFTLICNFLSYYTRLHCRTRVIQTLTHHHCRTQNFIGVDEGKRVNVIPYVSCFDCLLIILRSVALPETPLKIIHSVVTLLCAAAK